MKYLSTFVLIFSMGLTACEYSDLPPWEASIPVLASGSCRTTTQNLSSKREAEQAVEDMKTTLTSLNSDFYYTITAEGVFQYNSYANRPGERNPKAGDLWGAYVDYDCNGNEIFVYISSPLPVAIAELEKDSRIDELEFSGYVILAVDSELIPTSEGDYIIYSIYYTYDNHGGEDTATPAPAANSGEFMTSNEAIPFLPEELKSSAQQSQTAAEAIIERMKSRLQ